RHHEVSPANGVPSNAATCFCSSTSASARSARFCHRLSSRACSASFLSRGSTTRRAGPRFFGAPASSPRSRAARHVVRCEEYSPSRRSNAPTAPGVLQPSASRTIFRLYSTVNRRRVAFATTSIAGPPRACSNALIALRSCLALDTKLPGGHCLTHIGREGPADRGNLGRTACFVLGSALAVFWTPVSMLVRLAFQDEQYSHILLIPPVSAARQGDQPPTARSSRKRTDTSRRRRSPLPATNRNGWSLF